MINILMNSCISPQSGFEENVYGEKKLHIRHQYVQLPRSPFRFRQGTSDRKQKLFQQNLYALIGYRKKKNHSLRVVIEHRQRARALLDMWDFIFLSFPPSVFCSDYFLTNQLSFEGSFGRLDTLRAGAF